MLDWLEALYPDWLGSLYSDREGKRSVGDESVSTSQVEARADGTGTEEAEARADGADARLSWEEVLDGAPLSKQRVWMELGLRPDEFLVELVRRSGGRMWQGDIVSTTDWSKATVSRQLNELESNGIVERVQIGRRKLVALPGEMPDSISVESPHGERPSETGEPA